jgi:hypothetical protein
MAIVHGIGDAVRLFAGRCPEPGDWYAWPVDGYYDLHFVPADRADYGPDGSDVVAEGFATIRECRAAARANQAAATNFGLT